MKRVIIYSNTSQGCNPKHRHQFRSFAGIGFLCFWLSTIFLMVSTNAIARNDNKGRGERERTERPVSYRSEKPVIDRDARRAGQLEETRTNPNMDNRREPDARGNRPNDNEPSYTDNHRDGYQRAREIDRRNSDNRLNDRSDRDRRNVNRPDVRFDHRRPQQINWNFSILDSHRFRNDGERCSHCDGFGYIIVNDHFRIVRCQYCLGRGYAPAYHRHFLEFCPVCFARLAMHGIFHERSLREIANIQAQGLNHVLNLSDDQFTDVYHIYLDYLRDRRHQDLDDAIDERDHRMMDVLTDWQRDRYISYLQDVDPRDLCDHCYALR